MVFNDQMWLVATTMDDADKEHFHNLGKFNETYGLSRIL